MDTPCFLPLPTPPVRQRSLSYHRFIYLTKIVAPVFWYTSVEKGGFGFSELEIALFLGLAGASQAIWTLLVFPPLQHRVGTGGILRICAVAWPIFFFANPFGNIFLRNGWNVAFWAIVPAGNAFGAGVSMAFS
jgi:hypothetical protein